MKTNAERFWSKVAKTETCWIWMGCIEKSGYGRFRERLEDGTYRSEYAHIYAYKESNRTIEDGKVLDHIECENRACIRPDHLEPKTIGENVLRGKSIPAQNARKNKCVLGHEFSKENTYCYRDSQGYDHRQCFTCMRRRESQRVRRIA